MPLDCCSCPFTDTAILSPSTCGANFTLFMGFIGHLLQKQCDIADPCSRSGRDDFHVADAALYDFIVVGAGVAGSVIASRLANHNTVLLLEAGPEEPSAGLVPAFANSAVGSSVDWQYKTEPQQRACLANGGVCRWPRGKMVSGTAGMQGMMYNRGHPSIYDNWEAAGNAGWGYRDVLPYFIKAENDQDVDRDEGYHGHEGPLVVGRFPHRPPLADAIVAAGVELGYRHGDLNGRNQTGFDVSPMMWSDGLRGTTARMYLRRAAKGNKVHVLINSHVTRVLIGSDGKAVGVEYLDSSGVKKTALARNEVILSAGAIGSPQILLLSGIGPRKDLEDLEIPVLLDIPVGRILLNHVATSVSFTINDTSHQVLTLEALSEYLVNHTGPMASTGLTQTTGFMLSKHATNNTPDLQVFFDGFRASCSRTGQSDECIGGHFGDCGRRAINARPTVTMPRSRGVLKLKTKNPSDHPFLDPKYFDQSIDADILVDGIRKIIALTETSALRKWDFQLNTNPSKGCENFTFGSDAYWHCHVRKHTGAENHQGGTCKMGPVTDPEAVVDPQLRVHGVRNLRVVDASIFPYMPNSNPSASIVMMAEKCADMIKETWGLAK